MIGILVNAPSTLAALSAKDMMRCTKSGNFRPYDEEIGRICIWTVIGCNVCPVTVLPMFGPWGLTDYVMGLADKAGRWIVV